MTTVVLTVSSVDVPVPGEVVNETPETRCECFYIGVFNPLFSCILSDLTTTDLCSDLRFDPFHRCKLAVITVLAGCA